MFGAAAWLLLSAASLFAQNGLANPEIERRIDVLLRQMTLAEKIGQLTQYSAGAPTGPGTGRAGYSDQVAQGEIGSFLNLSGAAQTNALQRIAVERSRLKIPLLFGLDIIHGYHTIFPVPLGLASTWDPELLERAARVAAKEATAEGIRWTFSPMVDIARDARWGRIVEGAGEDPYLGSVMAAASVRGYQGARLDSADSLAACAKHFVGYGAAEAGRDYNAADMSEHRLRQVYLPPFAAAVRAGAASVMSAFNSLNAVPATADAMTLTRILRQEWGFRGLVVSDWNAVEELIAQGIATNGATAARKALLAGVDMDMESGLYQHSLRDLVRSGALPETAVDEAVRRVLRVKFALGLFDHPYTPEGLASPALQVELARQIAERSLILLKNEPVNSLPPSVTPSQNKPLLPLPSRPQTIALVGPLADSPVDMLGSWPGKGDVHTVVTLKSALQERIRQLGGRLLYAPGTEIDTASEVGFGEALKVAQGAGVTIVALGEDAARMTGEAASRASLTLPGNQQRLLETVASPGKPVVLIVFSGRPLALTWAAAHVAAIIQAWYPGIQAGPALTRVLFGDANFSGKLTVSMPRSVGQEPLYYNALKTGRPAGNVDLTRPPATEAEKYVSRYIDEINAPLFLFGYGLSYTRFTYSSLNLAGVPVSARALNDGSAELQVSATITNSGSRAGREIAQLYIGQRGTSVVLPEKELKGFSTVELAPGQSREVEFKLGREQLAFWNIAMHHEVEPSEVTVWIGPNAAEGQQAQFKIAP